MLFLSEVSVYAYSFGDEDDDLNSILRMMDRLRYRVNHDDDDEIDDVDVGSLRLRQPTCCYCCCCGYCCCCYGCCCCFLVSMLARIPDETGFVSFLNLLLLHLMMTKALLLPMEHYPHPLPQKRDMTVSHEEERQLKYWTEKQQQYVERVMEREQQYDSHQTTKEQQVEAFDSCPEPYSHPLKMGSKSTPVSEEPDDLIFGCVSLPDLEDEERQVMDVEFR